MSASSLASNDSSSEESSCSISISLLAFVFLFTEASAWVRQVVRPATDFHKRSWANFSSVKDFFSSSSFCLIVVLTCGESPWARSAVISSFMDLICWSCSRNNFKFLFTVFADNANLCPGISCNRDFANSSSHSASRMQSSVACIRQ